jgi:hypothetical protein
MYTVVKDMYDSWFFFSLVSHENEDDV